MTVSLTDCLYSTPGGYDGMGDALLSESPLSILWRSPSSKPAGQKWLQSWPATGVVSGLWAERDGAVRDGVLGFECRTSDIRDGDPGLGRRQFAAEHRPDCAN